MFRILALVALFPSTAFANWSPHPLMFAFEHTFEACISDPEAPDLAETCTEALQRAYALKRAVAWAAYRCDQTPLADCAIPFEEEGLPAIAMQIATGMGCDGTDVGRLPQGAPLGRDHCIVMASDIMNDEGVVPLFEFTPTDCIGPNAPCVVLAQMAAAFWVDQVNAAAPNDVTVQDLQARNMIACGARRSGLTSTDLASLNCLAARMSTLWADITLQNLKDY